MKKDDSQEPEDKLEIVDLADLPGLNNYRSNPKPGPDELDLADDSPDDFSFADDLALPEVFQPKPERLRPRGRPARPTSHGQPGPSGSFDPAKSMLALSMAAKILKLHPRTLRIYEELGLVVPFHTETQRRRYSWNDIEKIEFIQFLTQHRRTNLEGVRIILEMLDEMRRLGVSDPVKRYFTDFRGHKKSG